jgi:hypothetical protein
LIDKRQLWTDIRLKLLEYQNLRTGSDLFESLVASGVNLEALRQFIEAGRGRKHPQAQPLPYQDTFQQTHKLLDAGGHIAGGAAVRAWRKESHLDRDVDIFFNDFAEFVKAHLAAFYNSRIDVCLFKDKPYELFDLDTCCASYNTSKFDIDPACQQAFKTHKSHIRMDCIVHPTATLRRIAKYGSKYSMKFIASEILWLAMVGKVEPNVVKTALQYT